MKRVPKSGIIVWLCSFDCNALEEGKWGLGGVEWFRLIWNDFLMVGVIPL